ncbi:MAG: SDR family oxidoreductase [Planctomycetes bacterium]|nr:SDR family oxidoreductase [Planctomycetota bacterium]
MTHLRNKRALITGSGHGLGRELAKTFAKAGCEIIVTDCDADRVNETVSMLTKSNHHAFGYAMDVTNLASVQDVHDHVFAEHGPIDILINNAGIVCGGTFEHLPLVRHKVIYDVNCLGPVNVTHTLLPELLTRPESHIVNIASASALMPLPFAATYASSKWAVLGFSESLREELRLTGHENIHITSVCPGYISTGMFAGVKTPFLMPMLTPQILADEIVRAVQLDCEIVRTPWQVKLLPVLNGIVPRWLLRWLGDKLGVLDSMSAFHNASEPTRLAKEPLPVSTTESVPAVLSD